MFDDFSKRSKAVRAALDLAKDKGWGEIGLSDIAAAANVGLADLRREFICKSDILCAFQAEVDAEVLAKARVAGEAQSPRDRLFDAIMTRFEVMQPYKHALKRISAYLCCRPGEAAPLLLLGGLVFVSYDPNGLLSGYTTLPIQIFNWTGRPQEEFRVLAAAASIVLLILLLAMNALAIYIRNHFQRRW